MRIRIPRPSHPSEFNEDMKALGISVRGRIRSKNWNYWIVTVKEDIDNTKRKAIEDMLEKKRKEVRIL